MSRKVPTGETKFKFKGFENVDFSVEDRDVVQAWLKKGRFTPIDCATVLVEGGYKVSLGYDDYSSVNVVSLTCKDAESKYYGTCFTFKHGDLGKGLQIARYLYDTSLKDGLYELGAVKDVYDW